MSWGYNSIMFGCVLVLLTFAGLIRSVDSSSYLVFSTRSGFSCDGDLKAYVRYTLDQCMTMAATVDGYAVLSGHYVAHPTVGGTILLRLRVYTDDSCVDYLDTIDVSSFPNTCVDVNAPTPAPTIYNEPTVSPSASPTKAPTASPSTSPTPSPTVSPTLVPTVTHTGPTYRPTHFPTVKPTTILRPSAPPTAKPSVSPTRSPTFNLETSFSDWDDQIATGRIAGDHSYVAEIVAHSDLPTDTGFFTKMTPTTQHCGDDRNIFMYHWTSNTNQVTAKCKSKGSILFTSYQNSTSILTTLQATVTAGSTGDDDYPLGKDDMNHCFAGSEVVMMEDGGHRMISEVKVGDVVVAADRYGNKVLSPIIAVPHRQRNSKSHFLRLTTKAGKDIMLTHEHLIAAERSCVISTVPSLIRASDIMLGMCLYSTASNGYVMDEVINIESMAGVNSVTVVPKDELIVVNGFLSSPFAFNHAANSAYYNIWRSIHSIVPSIVNSEWVRTANELFGFLAIKMWKL